MFDLRYHVASLAAVFLALVIGILVGVGMSGGVDEGEKQLLQGQIRDLRAELDAVEGRVRERSREQDAAEEVVDQAYPLLVDGRLVGKRIALVFIGSVDSRLSATIERALDEAGAPPPLRVRALEVPTDWDAVDATLRSRPGLRQYAGAGEYSALGRALGEELVAGGETPLWDALDGELVEERIGGSRIAADGVVVARTLPPQRAGGARFLSGLYAGLGATEAPAVGVETTDAADSAIEVFRRSGISSVDDLNTKLGRLALVLVLAGADEGHYGVKPTARDGVLPDLDTLPPPEAAVD
jgi:hypothetical protein